MGEQFCTKNGKTIMYFKSQQLPIKQDKQQNQMKPFTKHKYQQARPHKKNYER